MNGPIARVLFAIVPIRRMYVARSVKGVRATVAHSETIQIMLSIQSNCPGNTWESRYSTIDADTITEGIAR
jgi:hypothetical protein